MINLGAIIWKLFIESNYITSIFLRLDTCEFVFSVEYPDQNQMEF
jgi:hypothetical protein